MTALFLQSNSSSAAQSLILRSSTTPIITYSISVKFQGRFPNKTQISAKNVPARDRLIDFGRHKGKMMGTLPSTYLKWVSDNLRARDFEDWAKLADEVLNDPVYRDRIEWEFADKVLNGDASAVAKSDGGAAVSELLEISQRFGWDNDDKVGWSKIDFGLLGTSKGGRIPRVSEKELKLNKREKVEEVDERDEAVRGGWERRKERRERLRSTRGGGEREQTGSRLGFGGKIEERSGNSGIEDDDGVIRDKDRTVEKRSSPFPGRESLLKKALNIRRR